MLEEECRAAGVRIFLNAVVREVRRDREFVVRAGDAEFHAPALVVATGGLSIPKIGATAFGYELARQFGLKIQECRPALVPLTFDAEDRERYCDLAGVSADVMVSYDSQRVSRQAADHAPRPERAGDPADLVVLAERASPSRSISLPAANGSPRCDSRSTTRRWVRPRQRCASVLPSRLADRWLDLHAPEDWTNRSLDELEQRAHQWQVIPSGTEGYEKAEVTAGGVDTNELSAKTMESRKMPGLYFIGEVVDVTGHLGGFNFQWAWASGFCAGQFL